MYRPAEQYKHLYRTTRWRKLSQHCRQQQPYCVFCGAPSQVCDHKEPHKGDRGLFFDIKKAIFHFYMPCSRVENTLPSDYESYRKNHAQDVLGK